MDSLKEIIKIISKKRLDKIELIDESMVSSEDTLFSRLYMAIKNDIVSNDSEAVKYLYKVDNQSNNQSYRRLKSRLRTRIFNTLYFLDLNSSNITSNYQKIIFDQNKAIQTINILRRNGATSAPISIIKNNFQTAINFHLYDVAKFYAFEMAKYYAMSGKQKSFDQYKALYEEFSVKEAAIHKATLVYYQIQFFVHHTNEKTNFNKKNIALHNLLDELKHHRDVAYSYDTEYFYLRAKLFLYEYSGYMGDILETCDEITKLSTQKQFNQPVWQGVSALYRAKALLSLQRYEEGLANLAKDISLFNEGGLNWFTAKEFQLKLALHLLDHDLSDNLLTEIMKHKSFKGLPEFFKQKMFIYRIYQQLLKDELLLKENKRLKLAKLYNDTPYYVNDKSGFYLSIRILDMIEHIRTSDYDAFADKCVLVKRYKQQFLKDNNTLREACFIEMLISVDKLKYNKKTVQMKNRANYERLKSNNDMLLVNDYEILPYHFLWEIILKYLVV